MKPQCTEVNSLLKDRELGSGRARIWTPKPLFFNHCEIQASPAIVCLPYKYDTSKGPTLYVISSFENLGK